MRQPTVYLLSCGDELLFGHTLDTNSAWLAQECTLLGWRIVGHRTIGDVTPDIVGAFLDAASRADVVIVTGGLGPTRDDRTRNGLAHAMGVSLFEDPEAVEEIAARFRQFKRPMGENNKLQALIPEGAKRIFNPAGTAPGIEADLLGARVFCVPGVPKEMRAMFDQTIRPHLTGAPGATSEYMRRLHLCGCGESEIGAMLQPLMRERSNPEISTTVAETIVTVRLYANGATLDEAKRVAGEAEKEVRAILGGDIYGVAGETLQAAVSRLLKERGASVVTA
ncbi:MAG: competence/damage-inducible protein A, partial [Planctomycetes bacterium]|nr:competence/damage-inducible protein A [Planctomycetota bacterium]